MLAPPSATRAFRQPIRPKITYHGASANISPLGPLGRELTKFVSYKHRYTRSSAQRRVQDSWLCQTKAALLSSPRLVIRVHRTHNQASHQPERDIFRTHQHDHSSGTSLLPMITGHHQLQTRLAPTPSYIFAAPRTYTCGSALLTTGGRNNGSL